MHQEEMLKIYENEKTRISIKENWCKECNICINYCPKKVLVANENGKPVAKFINECIQCMLCELRCPDFAIMVEIKENSLHNSISKGGLKD